MSTPTAAPLAEVQSPDDRPIPDLVSPRRRIGRVALVATILGLLVFLALHLFLAAYEVGHIRDAVERGTLDVDDGDRISLATYASSLLGGGLTYLTLAVGVLAVASRGHRFLFALPALAYIFLPVIDGGPLHPEPVGSWAMHCFSCGSSPWFAHPWVGPLVDLALVLAPGWIVGRRVQARRWPGRVDAAAVASILTCSAAVATAFWAISVIERGADERVVVAIVALGFALGVTRPWWPWLHVLFAVSTAGVIGWMLNFLLWPEPEYALSDALLYALGRLWPIVAVGLIASAWQPLAWVIRKLQERPFRLAIAVNLLNLLDAMMTLVAVRSGGAIESNPVVRFAGLPAKIVLVGLLTWLLYRRKPSALVWPLAALLWVAGYHVAGIVVNGWR